MSIWNTMSLFAKSNSTSILTGFAITGVVTTGIFAGKASIKAEKILEDMEGKPVERKEKIKAVAPVFIPAVISGTATILCIFLSHSIDSQKQVALMSAYSMSEHAMKAMEEKLGDKKVKQIQDSIFEDEIRKNPPKESDFKRTGKGNTKFKDGVFGGYFYSDIEYVKSVFNKYNKILNDINDEKLTDYYVFVNDLRWDLGLDQIEMGSIMGWSDGQLEERLTSIILDKDLQEATEGDVDNVFVISYRRPYEINM